MTNPAPRRRRVRPECESMESRQLLSTVGTGWDRALMGLEVQSARRAAAVAPAKASAAAAASVRPAYAAGARYASVASGVQAAAAGSTSTNVAASAIGEPCDVKQELFLVLDGSASISNAQYEQIKTFVKGLSAAFVMSPESTRIGVVQFSSQGAGEVVVPLTADRAQLTAAVDRMTRLDGATDISEGLDIAQNQLVAQGRDKVPRVMVLLTDGENNAPGDPIAAAKAIREAGTQIMTIGIGSQVRPATLKPLASAANFSWNFKDYAGLNQSLAQIAEIICGAVDPPAPQEILKVTIAMDPATDSGQENTDQITNVTRPAFQGVSNANAVITLLAQISGGTTAQEIGTTTAAADGAWRIVANDLAPGTYQISARAAVADQSVVTTLTNPVIIDTKGPVVNEISMQAAKGQFTVTFQDNAAGMNRATLIDTKNYALVPMHRSRNVSMPVTGVEAQTTDNATDPQFARVLVNNGTPLQGRVFVTKVASGGIADLAGNALDGEFTGRFPSGNGTPGGNFGAVVTVNNPNSPGTVQALTAQDIIRANDREPTIPLGDSTPSNGVAAPTTSVGTRTPRGPRGLSNR